jgi:hypothetical protein
LRATRDLSDYRELQAPHRIKRPGCEQPGLPNWLREQDSNLRPSG